MKKHKKICIYANDNVEDTGINPAVNSALKMVSLLSFLAMVGLIALKKH